MPIKVDWTIPVWNVLLFGGAILTAYLSIIVRLARIETKVDPIWNAFTSGGWPQNQTRHTELKLNEK